MSKLELVIDSEDNYLDAKNVFYVHPNRLHLVKHMNDQTFSSALVKNVDSSVLTSTNLGDLLRKLKVQASLEIIVNQPLTCMHALDSKLLEANLKFAGYDKFNVVETQLEDPKTNAKIRTVLISCVRPERNPNAVAVDLEIKRIVPDYSSSSRKIKK